MLFPKGRVNMSMDAQEGSMHTWQLPQQYKSELHAATVGGAK